jgi:hypothetical protein
VAATSIAVSGFSAHVIAGPTEPTSQKPPEKMETYDDLLVRVEEQVPGFGGMFIDRQGRLAVYLLDPSQLATARSAIETVFGVDRVPAAGVRALQGQYIASQLKRWSELAAAVLELPGVTILDLDEARHCVAIGVEDQSRTWAVEHVLSRLAIPLEAVVIDVTGEIRPLDDPVRPQE